MGGTDLTELIRSIRPELQDGTFVFATLPPGEPAPAGLTPVMTFRERDGLTLVVAEDDARDADLASAFPCRMITLTIHSGLDAVGFLAAVTTRLAAAGVSCNAVAGYYHDHLFVPADRAIEALRLLETMSLEIDGDTREP